jgi:hypothetical protein
MKKNRVFSTALLFLLLGTTALAYAQKGPKEKAGGGQKVQHTQPAQRSQHAQPAQRSQHAQQAQRSQRTQQAQRSQHAQPAQRSQHTQQAQRSQRTQQAQRSQHAQQAQRSQHAQQGQRATYNRGNTGNHYGRIPDDRYRAHFGRGHSFRMIRPRMIDGYQRFQYNGYWFGFNDPWPSGWYYTDNVYVDYVGGAYYMYNPRHPGIHIRLNLF